MTIDRLATLGEDARAAVADILAGRKPWIAARRLKKVVLDELTAGGWAEVCALPAREVVTLTPWAAEALGVELVGPEDRLEWRWEEVDPDRPQPNELVGTEAVSMTHPDLVVSREPTPLDYLISLEEGETTDDPGRALTIFNAPVRLDRRRVKQLAERRRRKARKASGTGRSRTGARKKAPTLSADNCPAA